MSGETFYRSAEEAYQRSLHGARLARRRPHLDDSPPDPRDDTEASYRPPCEHRTAVQLDPGPVTWDTRWRCPCGFTYRNARATSGLDVKVPV